MTTDPIGTRPYPLTISDEQWRERLTPAEYQVLRQGATERPGVGEYEEVRAAGGRYEVVNLPQVGIKGNSHMMMMDKNNLQVADVIQDWLEKQGLYK